MYRLVCRSCEVQPDNNSTKITASGDIGEWSDVIYIRECRYIPVNCEFRVKLVSKSTAKRSGNKYWNADNITIIVNRAYIWSLLEQHLGWRTSKLMNLFEQRVDKQSSDSVEGEDYAHLWISYITKNVFKDNVSKGMKYVLEKLQSMSSDVFTELFAKSMKSKGLTDKQSQDMTKLLDMEDSIVSKPHDLADEWTARPYSPYLKGLSEEVRDVLTSRLESKEMLNDERVRYVCHKILETEELNGNTYMPVEVMLKELKRRNINVSNIDILNVDDCYKKPKKNKLRFLRNPTMAIEDGYVQHSDVAQAEKGLLDYWYSCGKRDLGELSYYDTQGLNSEQQKAFDNAFKYRISSITGGPGRGKTWLSQRLCDAWQRRVGGNVLVVSSYHQPLKNLERGMLNSEDLKLPCAFRTIASSSCQDTPLFCECVNNKNVSKHLPGLLIVEEAGVCTMVDMYRIIHRVLQPGRDCKLMGEVSIVLLGDDKQLKPIGAGQPFTEFIKFYPQRTVRLQENMRTNSPNVCDNITTICNGRTTLKEGSDFVWLHDVPLVTESNLVGFFNRYLKNFDTNQDVVIVHKNETRQLLNKILHNKHLPDLAQGGLVKKKDLLRLTNTKAFSYNRFVPGTRVVCKETSACKKITNGTRGIIERAIVNEKVCVKCEDGKTYTTYAKSWELAYSITAHKAQGNEYRSPYIYSFNDHYVAKDWLYTAVSRAKEKVIYMVPKKQHILAVSVHKVKTNLSLMASRLYRYTSRPNKRQLELT